jgi:hypothetical protein
VVSVLQRDNQELREQQQALKEQNEKLLRAVAELQTLVTGKRKIGDTSGVSSPAVAPSGEVPSAPAASPQSVTEAPAFAVDLEASDDDIPSEPKKTRVEDGWEQVPDVMERADEPTA